MASHASAGARRVAWQISHATAPALRGGGRRPAPIAAAAPRSASVPPLIGAGLSARRHLASGPHFNGFFGGGGFPGQAPPKGDSEKFYKTLDIDKSADEKTIKSAYKKQAMQHHPDRGGDEATFKEITKAYEVLSNPEKKQIYDTYGEEGLEGMDQGGGGAPGADPFDLFSQIFGFNAGGGRGRQRARRPVTPDSAYEMQLTLEELYTGTKRNINFTRDKICKACSGMGGHNTTQCGHCKGTGRQVTLQQMGMFVQQQVAECGKCSGRGYVIPPGDLCGSCKGHGTTKEKMPFDINIDPGSQDGTEFRFQGAADEAPGHDTGDVVIMIRQKPHKTFQRFGDSLIMSKSISLTEALCGVEFSTKFLDGEELVVRSTAGEVIKPGDVMTIEGKGMPRGPGRTAGNLYVRFDVDFPKKVEPASQEKIAEVLGGAPLSEEPPLGSQHAKKLTTRQMQEVQQQIRASKRNSSQGQQEGQGAQCQQM